MQLKWENNEKYNIDESANYTFKITITLSKFSEKDCNFHEWKTIFPDGILNIFTCPESY